MNVDALSVLFPELPIVQSLAISFNSIISSNTTIGTSVTNGTALSNGVISYNLSLSQGTLGDYSSWLIAARLRQWRVSGKTCLLPEYLALFFSECDPEYSFDNEDHNGFGNLSSDNEAFIYRYTFSY